MTMNGPPTPEERSAMTARRDTTMRRFHTLRRRRLLERAGAAIAVAAMAIAASLFLVGSSDQATHVLVPAGVPSSTSPAVSSPAATTLPPTTKLPSQSSPATPASTPVRSTTLPPAPSTTGTPPSCSDQQFTAQTATDHSDYTRGQTVKINVTMTNSGPTCEGVPPWFCGQHASIYNSSHADVWDSGAGPNSPSDVTGCPAAMNQLIAHGSSSTQSLAWQQDQCTFDNQAFVVPNPDCPGTQVPDGTYAVIGDSGKAPAVSITISG